MQIGFSFFISSPFDVVLNRLYFGIILLKFFDYYIPVDIVVPRPISICDVENVNISLVKLIRYDVDWGHLKSCLFYL